MKVQTLVLWFAVMLIGNVSFAEETEPSAIFTKVIAAYESMETYSSEGTIISDIETGGVKVNMETSFLIKLKKPNLYLISWDQKNAMMPNFTQTGAVWNDGSQPYLFMGDLKAYSKMSSDELALGAATGISSGATYTMPSFFLPVFKKPTPFSRLVDPKLEGNEQVEGEDCYVISGSSIISKKETFWISKETSMIRKYSRSLEMPEGGIDMPKMTDQQLEEAIKAIGQEVTEETKEAMKKMMKQARDTMKTAKLKGTLTELHSKIATPKLIEGDFVFKVPVGTALKESLFGGVLNAKQQDF